MIAFLAGFSLGAWIMFVLGFSVVIRLEDRANRLLQEVRQLERLLDPLLPPPSGPCTIDELIRRSGGIP